MNWVCPYVESIRNWFADLETSNWIDLGGIALTALLSILLFWLGQKRSKPDDSLTALQIAQAKADADAAKSADVSADFAKSGKSYHLKIYNRGPSPAFNVNAELLKGAELIVASDLAEKLPMIRMEPHSGTHLIAAPHMGSPRKLTIRLTWDDDRKKGNEKTLELAW